MGWTCKPLRGFMTYKPWSNAFKLPQVSSSLDLIHLSSNGFLTHLTPPLICSMTLQDLEGPIARLMRSVKSNRNNTRIGTFAYLAGLSPDGVVWPPATWHFLLHVLHCLRLLLAGGWAIWYSFVVWAIYLCPTGLPIFDGLIFINYLVQMKAL